MEHKNSFHIKKLNHQSGFGWAEMMRAGYVWLAALLCWDSLFYIVVFRWDICWKRFCGFYKRFVFFCSIFHSFYGEYSKSFIDFLPNSL